MHLRKFNMLSWCKYWRNKKRNLSIMKATQRWGFDQGVEGRWRWRYSRRNMSNQPLTPDRQTTNNRLKFNLMNNEFYWGYLQECWWEGDGETTNQPHQKWFKDNCFTKAHPSMGGAHCTACRSFNRLEGVLSLWLHLSEPLPGNSLVSSSRPLGLSESNTHGSLLFLNTTGEGGLMNPVNFMDFLKLIWTLGFLS